MLKAKDARHKSIYKNNIPIKMMEWNVIGHWNASLVLFNSGIDILYKDKQYVNLMRNGKTLTEKSTNRDKWCFRIVNELIRKQGTKQFLLGEESSNWPKIKEYEYKNGISIDKITDIIMSHREALEIWKQNKLKKTKPIIKRHTIHKIDDEELDEELNQQETPIIRVDVVDNWEDLIV